MIDTDGDDGEHDDDDYDDDDIKEKNNINSISVTE